MDVLKLKKKVTSESPRNDDIVEDSDDDDDDSDSDIAENLNTSSCIMTESLLDMNYCGIDTDSGKSISTRLSDFLWLDNSIDAKSSIEIHGVGGAGTQAGGRGPMAICVINNLGHSMILVDPEGVYIIKDNNAPEFRVLGQQWMKKLAVAWSKVSRNRMLM